MLPVFDRNTGVVDFTSKYLCRRDAIGSHSKQQKQDERKAHHDVINMAVLGKICRKAILDNPTGQC